MEDKCYKGRYIIIGIICAVASASTFSMLFNIVYTKKTFNIDIFISIFFQIVLIGAFSGDLYRGRNWARWAMTALTLLRSLICLIGIIHFLSALTDLVPGMVSTILFIIYSICSITLIASKDIKHYIRSKKQKSALTVK